MSVAEETGLSLVLSESLKTAFVVSRPIWYATEQAGIKENLGC